jgi:carbonic anhydrase
MRSTPEEHHMMESVVEDGVVPELLAQRDPGELFVIRNAGKLVPAYRRPPPVRAPS